MQEQELDLGYIFSIIKKWGFLILLFVILGLSAAIFYNYESPIVYQSEASLYVEPPVSSNQVNYDGILSNQKMEYFHFLKILLKNSFKRYHLKNKND